MPADLKRPFAESCCDGGACDTSGQSAQPCGCDMGCKPKPYFCERHRTLEIYPYGFKPIVDVDIDEYKKMFKER